MNDTSSNHPVEQTNSYFTNISSYFTSEDKQQSSEQNNNLEEDKQHGSDNSKEVSGQPHTDTKEVKQQEENQWQDDTDDLFSDDPSPSPYRSEDPFASIPIKKSSMKTAGKLIIPKKQGTKTPYSSLSERKAQTKQMKQS